ncbi:MAG: NAD(P)H-dependent oxidoreductase, partial [Oscillospiraceae bacterium]|nr:NAD(P)H-dependent oxidoreductase [Oscillospiraceae bacterium]
PVVMGWAEKVRDADRIVIAAPFWDMSFPAALKNFFELCSIFDVTFKSDDKTCFGNCRAEKLLYITTRGMDIATGDVLEQATPYLKALSWLWGIGPLQVVSAQNMDYSTEEEIERKIGEAIDQGLEIAKTF